MDQEKYQPPRWFYLFLLLVLGAFVLLWEQLLGLLFGSR